MSAVLTVADLRFLNLIATRRVGAEPVGDGVDLDAAAAWPGEQQDGRPRFDTPFLRAAALASATVRVFPSAALPTAVFAICAQLRLEGYQLTAPQGVLAGMLQGLEAGTTSVEDVGRWLEDRTLKAG